MWNILFSKQADKVLRKVPKNVSQLIRSKLDQLAKNPHARNINATKLQGRSGYRLWVDDWRIIYEIQDAELIMLVLKIGSRGDIYQ